MNIDKDIKFGVKTKREKEVDLKELGLKKPMLTIFIIIVAYQLHNNVFFFCLSFFDFLCVKKV